MEIFTNTRFDFLRWRYHVLAATILFTIIGFGWFAARGLNVGIDFSGGANVVLRFKNAVPIDSLRAAVPSATIQRYGRAEDNSVLIRLPKLQQEGDYAGQVVQTLHARMNPEASQKLDLNFQGRAAIAELLKAEDPDKQGTTAGAHDYYYNLAQAIITRRSELGLFRTYGEVTSIAGVSPATGQVLASKTLLGEFNVLGQETVGPQVGRELQNKAIWAIALSTLAMGIYIAVRFDFRFGVAAIITLVHDVLVAFAFLVLVGGEFSLITVAAFLMIIGYSINDTVVIYDRVRENVKKSRVRESFEDLMNRSLNQTLSRTVLTGGSVLLILLSLILFGGEVIHDFALLLFAGVIIGTLSTLWIVPAVVLAWNRWVSKSRGGEGAGRRMETAARTDAPVLEGKSTRSAKG